MNCVKKHISILLLLGFLFPQGANAVHHFLVPHKYSPGDTMAHFSKPAYDYHSCDYHLSGLKTLIPDFNYSFEKNIPGPEQENLITEFLLFPEEVAFNFSVRGPPC